MWMACSGITPTSYCWTPPAASSAGQSPTASYPTAPRTRPAVRTASLPPSPAPATETIEATYGWKENILEERNYSSIYFSVLSIGDFGRYVIESGLRYFSRHLIGQPYPERPARTARFDTASWDRFVASSTDRRSRLLGHRPFTARQRSGTEYPT